MKVYYVVYLECDDEGFDIIQKRKKFYNKNQAEKYADELFDCGYAVKIEISKEVQ